MGREKWVFGCLGIVGAAWSFQAGKGVEAEKSYDTGFAKVELLGVCRATESEVACWGPEGQQVPDLQEEFKAAFIRNDYVSIPVKYGQKTRVAVFRFTNPPYNDPRGTIDAYFQNNSGSFDFPNRNPGSSNDSERIEIRGVILFAKPTDMTAKASTSIRRSAPPSKRMQAQVGATLDYLGTRFTLRKIVKAKLDPLAFGPEGANRWTIAMTAEDKEALPPQFAWVAIDLDGLVIRAVDKDGNPVPVDPNNSPYGGFNPTPGRVSVPKVFPAQLGNNFFRAVNSGDDFPLVTNINPAKIKEMFAMASSTEKLTITGIPLEPK